MQTLNVCLIDTFIDPKIGMAQAPLHTTHLLSLDNKSLMPRRKSEKLCSKTNTSGLPILVCQAVLLPTLTTKRNLGRNAAYTNNKRRHINFCMLDGYPSHYFFGPRVSKILSRYRYTNGSLDANSNATNHFSKLYKTAQT